MAATAWTDAALCSVPRVARASADAAAFSAAAAATALSATSIGLVGGEGGGTGTGDRDFGHRRGDLVDVTERLVGIELYVLAGHSCSSFADLLSGIDDIGKVRVVATPQR